MCRTNSIMNQHIVTMILKYSSFHSNSTAFAPTILVQTISLIVNLKVETYNELHLNLAVLRGVIWYWITWSSNMFASFSIRGRKCGVSELLYSEGKFTSYL